MPAECWPSRTPHDWGNWAAQWEALVELRAELDFLEFEEQTEAGWDTSEPILCLWCGAAVDADDPVSRALNEVRFSLKDYWGPLQFDESDRDRWRAALMVGDEWRWMDLVRPDEPGGRYWVAEPACSARCRDAFREALRRDRAGRRPQ